MTRPATAADNSSRPEVLGAMLDRMRAAQRREGPPDLALRRDRLERAMALLRDNRAAICEALASDFGHRSHDQSLLTDIVSALEPLKVAHRRVGAWMRPQRRRPRFPLGLLGARAEVQFQPLGVVGVISPWNFPVQLIFAPLAGILSAGNRAMIKPSEYTPATSELLRELIAGAFAPEEVQVVTGGVGTAAAFSALPFDHLLFTGSGAVGRKVMAAAAANLVPVTLELGGKSPVIISPEADMARAATRIMAGKLLNAGQICLAPDYVLVPRGREEAFADAAAAAVRGMYPTLRDNPDYTAIIHEGHAERLQGLIEDAAARGARLVTLNPAGEDLSQQPHRKMAPVLILDPTPEMAVMQEEIFGPVLPVLGVSDTDAAIAHVAAGPRPLALYWFGHDRAERTKVLRQTVSGGVTINDVVMHVAQEDLPFGGVGASGMGRYHGRDGFMTFSNARAVFSQGWGDPGRPVRPPYGAALRRALDWMARR